MIAPGACHARCTITGKTTVLRHLLQNSQGLKIGCIVNDVASVNIDAKLVRNDQSRGGDPANSTTADLADTIELQNGCVCTLRIQHWCKQPAPSSTPLAAQPSLYPGCSIQDELFLSFQQLLDVSAKKGILYDRYVYK